MWDRHHCHHQQQGYNVQILIPADGDRTFKGVMLVVICEWENGGWGLLQECSLSKGCADFPELRLIYQQHLQESRWKKDGCGRIWELQVAFVVAPRGLGWSA